jgi:hypothetical protein
MTDETEMMWRALLESGQPMEDLVECIQKGEPRWNTEELVRDFEVLGFMAPFVAARRRSDGAIGSLEFTHSPRVYFNWTEDGDATRSDDTGN